ncbi:MAG TPA: U32 family peptidase [Candidatus Limiplasma sp.]|nr:U32 family peptidase [Candidatus Limiplasma sp.]
MELLAPAGDEAALRAAVCAGANAVYLGYAQFGARASAANFDAEALEKAIQYAHLHHVRIYVTVNTLIKPCEQEAVFSVLATLAHCRADAVIVQDLGVARMAREHFPMLALHASTQMALHTAAGVRFAREHGFGRVVLARECTLPTIAAASGLGVETEVFAHGALCAGVSGQCLLSSMAGGRSGNRGRCAQPCRQAVTLGEHTAALISMRDLCLRDHLPELQAAGVTSLKIEGRLKRPEYVAVVTDSYRKALDAMARGHFAPMDAQERDRLMQIFHRGGFTVGHAFGAQDAALCSVDRVNHGGVAVGRIAAVQGGLATATLKTTVHDGDSLRVEGVSDVELRYAGPAQAARATLRLRPGETVRVGDPVVRTTDAEQLAWAQTLTEAPIPVTMRATVRVGEPLRLRVSDGQTECVAWGETAQAAVRRALTAEEIARSLQKLGDTPFVTAMVPEVDTNGAYAPVSALNALRRDALALLSRQRCAAFYGLEREALLSAGEKLAETDGRTPEADLATRGEITAQIGSHRLAGAGAENCVEVANSPQDAGTDAGLAPYPDAMPGAERQSKENLTDTLAISFSDASMGETLLKAGANLLLYAPRDWRAQPLSEGLAQLPQGAWLSLPPQLSDGAFQEALPVIQAHRKRIAGVALGSVGQLGFPIPLPIALGDGIPMTNREALREVWGNSVAFYLLWPELSKEELKALVWKDYPCLLRVYGRERVMLLNHCPERVARGLTAGRAQCALCGPTDRACASPDATLTDRKGFRFPLARVRTSEGCVVEAYNALPTDLSRQEATRRALGAGMLVSFSMETQAEQLAITERFAGLMRTGVAQPPEQPVTGGHFLRGVE